MKIQKTEIQKQKNKQIMIGLIFSSIGMLFTMSGMMNLSFGNYKNISLILTIIGVLFTANGVFRIIKASKNK